MIFQSHSRKSKRKKLAMIVDCNGLIISGLRRYRSGQLSGYLYGQASLLRITGAFIPQTMFSEALLYFGLLFGDAVRSVSTSHSDDPS